MDVIQCYAPTNDGTDADKESFYNQLHTIVQNRQRRNITIMMGDFNAKMGCDNTVCEEVMGKQGLGVMNDNGDRLANFCALNNFLIGGSFFQHRRIHKATLFSPDLTTENQIDHVCINKKFRSSLQDVGTRRGGDAASDHHLLVSHVRLKLRRDYNTGQNAKRQRIQYYSVKGCREAGRIQDQPLQ